MSGSVPALTTRRTHPPVHGTARVLPSVAVTVSASTLLALFVCLDALVLHEVPWEVTGLAFVGATIGLAGIIRAATAFVVLLNASRSLSRELGSAPELTGRPGILVVADDRPRAWCAGLARPRIVVSSGAVDTLAEEALDAVVAHERHHADRRDGLRRGLADTVAAGLFLLPDTARARERYGAVLELDADRAATLRPGGRRGLAAAMTTLDAAGSGVEPDRVDHLIGRCVRVDAGRRTLAGAAWLLLALTVVATGCTLATGCVDIFLLTERDATANRVELLPLVALTAGLLAHRIGARGSLTVSRRRHARCST